MSEIGQAAEDAGEADRVALAVFRGVAPAESWHAPP